jgi:hypothetical protein
MPSPTNEQIERDVRAAEKAGRGATPASAETPEPDTRAMPPRQANDVPAPFKTDDR